MSVPSSMATKKKPRHKVVMTEGKRGIIRQLLQEYDIQTAEDIQDALKDLLGGTIKEMKPRWMTTWAMKSRNALTAMITETATSPSGSTAVTAPWISRCLRTASLPMNHG